MIFMDLDGVLADFVGAACYLHGKPWYKVRKWNFYEEWGLSDEEFWEPINELGSSFYLHYVKPYNWTIDLWDAVKATNDEVVILTNSSDNVPGLVGKYKWIETHLGLSPREVIPCYNKGLLAGPGRLLIDDNDTNIIQFRKAGGHGILFPQPWNEGRDCGMPKLAYVESQLFTAYGGSIR